MSVIARSFDDLGTPLCDATFVVLDLETTGASPASCAITEIGAVRVRGGEVCATFQTLVNPGLPIPPSITFLTGITQAMVVPAPTIDEVIGEFVDFVGGAVIVGHNVRFDLGFLGAAMDRCGYDRFTNVVVDTCALARRLVRDEVPNCKLHTLSSHFRVSHRPTHRALDDALATTEVLHALLERAGSLGVLGLEDLVALPTVGGHPQLGKLTLTTKLPTGPGVYIFRDHGGRPLYVGKAVNLRRRVRSYFTGDERRKVGGLLRELATIDHRECSSELEASVLEVRLIHALTPRYNSQTKHWRSYAYVKLTLDEPWPRLAVVRQPRAGDGCTYIGPVGSVRAARAIVDALHSALPLRRCTQRLGASVDGTARRDGPCAPAQLGVATCPCAGDTAAVDYARIVDAAAGALRGDLEPIVTPLTRQLRRLARQQRFEEAAHLRDRAATLCRVVERQRRLEALRDAGTLHLRMPDAWALVEDGLLHSCGPGRHAPAQPELWLRSGAGSADGEPITRDAADEMATIASWLDRRCDTVEVMEARAGLAWPARRLRFFEQTGPSGRRSR